MDAELRAFLIVDVLAVGLAALALVSRYLVGPLSAGAALAAVLLLGLGGAYLALDDTEADRAVGRWLSAPFRGPAGWRRPRH